MKLPVRSALSALLLAFPLQAQFITGTVVDAGGAPVPGVNIDVFDVLTGDPVDVLNDGTDLNGFFLTTLPGSGVYDVRFHPAPPPAKPLLPTTVENVPVIGVADMGIIQLAQGFVVNGQTVDENLFPVAGVTVLVKDLATGETLDLQANTTSVFGTFAVAVAPGDYQIDLDTINASGPGVLAPQRHQVSVSATTPLEILVLEPGFIVTARFRDGNGAPVQGVDMDAVDRHTDEKIITLHDNSDGNGEMSVILPRGRFDLEFCPFGSPTLVAAEVSPVHVGADVGVGEIVLVQGVPLTGTVTDFTGTPVQGADLNLRDQALGTSIALCQDNTDADGVYDIVVPPGTYQVTVTAPSTTLLASTVFTNVVIAGPTVLDATLSTSVGSARDKPPSPPGAGPPGAPGGGSMNGPSPVQGPGASGHGTEVK